MRSAEQISTKKMNNGKIDRIQLPSDPSFLIILMGSLGDVARGLCLVSHIKNWYPRSSVTWLIEPQWAEIVRYHPLLHNILIFDRPHWRQGIQDIFLRLKAMHFDCVFDLQRHFKSGLFSFFSRAKCRIGFHPKNAKEGNWLFNTHHIPYQHEQYPKILHYLQFTDFLGIPHPEGLDFGFSNLKLTELNPEWAPTLRSPFLAVVLGSTWETKEWFFDQYCSLLQDLLWSTQFQIVLVDTKSKYDMACSLERKINNSRLLNLVGQTSVLELSALLKESCLAVGPDCGAGHLASAVGTPYVSLFGPTCPERTAPYGSEDLVVKAEVPCAPCYKKECSKMDRLCMRSIHVRDVEEKIFQSLENVNEIA